MAKTIVDYQAHLSETGGLFEWNLPFLRGKHYGITQAPQRMVRKAFRVLAHQNCNGLVAIPNCDDFRWQYAFSELHNYQTREWGIQRIDKSLCLLQKDGLELYLIGAQEIPTDKGHIVLIGCTTNENIPAGPIDLVLREADKKGYFRYIDHPLQTLPAWKTRLYHQITGHKINPLLGMDEEGIGRYGHRFDAIEIFNSNFPINPRIEQLADRFKIPKIASSDSHTPEGVFNGSTTFKLDLDFSSSTALNQSMRSTLGCGDLFFDQAPPKKADKMHPYRVALNQIALKTRIARRKSLQV